MMKKVKGARDYFDLEANKFSFVKDKLYKLAINNNYQEIIFPVLEELELFKHNIGENTDIVNKEMYTINRKSNDQLLVMRPEGTLPTVRLVLENKLVVKNQKSSFFYIANMFRYENPQKGRLREFYQFGVEIFNESSVWKDIEILLFAIKILNSFQIEKYELQINSLGSIYSRTKYLVELKKYFKENFNVLSSVSKQKFDKNPLRILDSKEKNDFKIIENAPKLIDFLTDEEKSKFNLIKENLDKLNIKYVFNPYLVRGLDYYNDLVFEFLDNNNYLGSQSTLIAGGRYNKLINKINKKYDIPALGFAIGIERLMLVADDYINKNITIQKDYYVVSLQEKYNNFTIKIYNYFSEDNHIYLDLLTQNLSKAINKALKNNFHYIIIVGEECQDNKIILKDLWSSTQKIILIDDFVNGFLKKEK